MRSEKSRSVVIKISLIAVTLILLASIASIPFWGTGETAYCNELAACAKSAYLVDDATGTVIFAKKENERLPIASMSKIMTALLAFEAIENGKLSLDDDVTVSENAASMGGSQVFLDAGSVHKAGDLLKTVIVASANDSCVALAERISGSVGGFVIDMNRRAKELGMENTNFVNCTGLPAPENFSSAKDCSIMFRELIKHPKYYEYAGIWLEDYTHPGGRTTSITNTNKLVRFYKGCDGGKTGFTSEAKFCLSATAKRGDMRAVCVVIGADSSKGRFAAVSEMFNYAFDNFSNQVLAAKGDPIANSVAVKGGKKDTIELTVERDVTRFMSRGESDNYEVKYELPESVKAKIVKGDVIGKAYLLKNGEVIDEINVVANEDVARSSVFDEIKRIASGWISYAR